MSKTKDKAARIDFSQLPGLQPAKPAVSASEAPLPSAPRTAPMHLMAQHQKDLGLRVVELEGQIAELKKLEGAAERVQQLEAELAASKDELRQWDGVKGARLLQPTDIVPSAFANRHPGNFESEAFKALLAEIEHAGGNVQPVKVRSLSIPRDGAHYELVYGHRRHRACLQLKLPVLALVDNVDDRTLFSEMDRENRNRQDLSPWEQGQMYLQALNEGLFTSLRHLADAVGANVSSISRSVALAKLPEVVVQAFGSPLNLQLRWGTTLTAALEHDRPGVLERAGELVKNQQRLSPAAVLEYLVNGEAAKGNEPAMLRKAVRLEGSEVGVLSVSKQGTRLELPKRALAEADLEELGRLVEEFLGGLTRD